MGGGEVYELSQENFPSETEKIVSLSAEAALSKAISKAERASRERCEGTWEVSILPKTKDGFAECLYRVTADHNRTVTVEVTT